ncbi:hypothetical protein YDYSY3_61140 [Paenibacillus chitinolyticus]|nr:hypothetical protein YDYSY3_61140 [Paenibacillus chitinolyticus]
MAEFQLQRIFFLFFVVYEDMDLVKYDVDRFKKANYHKCQVNQ